MSLIYYAEPGYWRDGYAQNLTVDDPFDVEQTIISQYGATSTIAQLCRNMGTYIDPATDFNTFYDYVWNVDTAQGFGLDIWGRIVDIGRILRITTTSENFGFKEALPGVTPFNDQPFYNGEATTQNYILEDEPYRKLILAKALRNIADCSVPSINNLLLNFFRGRGVCYIKDLGSMAIQYWFEFELDSYEIAIITQSGALPRPAGVSATLRISDGTIIPVN